VADLVGRPYTEDGCYRLAREVLARVGVELPADPAACLAGRDAIAAEISAPVLAAGDILELDGRGGRPHLGVMLDGFTFIHATGAGARIDRLEAWERLGKVRRRMRPWALMEGFQG
jgi:uncharacterized protein YijF (DUF1287 family)